LFVVPTADPNCTRRVILKRLMDNRWPSVAYTVPGPIKECDDMKRLLALSIISAITLIAAYLMLTAPSLPEQTRISQSGENVVIDMTTRQWRFDVVGVSPSGSAKFSTNPPEGQHANTTITVRKGDTIILRIKSLDVPHGFALEEFGVNVFNPPGETVEVKFVASQTGSFTFFCTVFCGTGHPNHKGTLIVQS